MAVGQHQRYHFGIGATPILEPILVVGLGCSLVWGLTHGQIVAQQRTLGARPHSRSFTNCLPHPQRPGQRHPRPTASPSRLGALLVRQKKHDE